MPVEVGENRYMAPAAANTATIRVLVGDPQAKIYFDGTLTKQEGTDRLFHTPALAGRVLRGPGYRQ